MQIDVFNILLSKTKNIMYEEIKRNGTRCERKHNFLNK